VRPAVRNRPRRNASSEEISVTVPAVAAGSTPPEWACPPAGNRASASSSAAAPLTPPPPTAAPRTPPPPHATAHPNVTVWMPRSYAYSRSYGPSIQRRHACNADRRMAGALP
jgi:hypothetical protein